MRSSRIVPVGLGKELESSLDAHDGDGEVREAGEVARQMAGTRPALVFLVGDVAHVVQPIFDAPMPSHEREDELGGGLFGGKRGQAVYGLVLDLAGVDVSPLALDAKRDRAMGQGGFVGVVGEVEHPAASLLDASVPLVRGSVLGGAHLGALPVEPGEVDEQVGLVGFDRGHHVVRAALLDHAPGGVVLHMHRVHGHDPAFEVQRGLCPVRAGHQPGVRVHVSMGPRFTRGLCLGENAGGQHYRGSVSMGPRFTRGLCPVEKFYDKHPNRLYAFQWGRALRADCVKVKRTIIGGTGNAFQWGRALRADCVQNTNGRAEMRRARFNGAALYARIVSRQHTRDARGSVPVSMGPRFTRGLCRGEAHERE